jgi:redox-regulated HSP33 family molecular chaperone
MFTEAQKTAYQNMTAPTELRGKVLEMAKAAPAKPAQTKRPVRRWMTTAVAACFVLVVSVSALLPRSGDVTLSLDGMEVTETATAFSASTPMTARAIASMCLPVTVETDEDAKLSVSCGQLLAEDGTEVTAVHAGETTLYWAISPVDTNETYELRLHGDTVTCMTLAFDAEENCWTVFAAKE